MFLTRKRNKRSNVNLSKVSATTLAPGNIVPISTTRIVAGDHVKFHPSAFVQAFPMTAPLVNGFKICLEYFFIPDRLYNVDLAMNFNEVTDKPEEVKFPQIHFKGYYPGETKGEINLSGLLNIEASDDYPGGNPNVADNMFALSRMSVSAGSLMDYLGLFPGYHPYGTYAYQSSGVEGSEGPDGAVTLSGNENGGACINAIPALGYLDIMYNYYANQQIDSMYTAMSTDSISTYDFTNDGGTGLRNYYKISLDVIKDILYKAKTQPVTEHSLDDIVSATGETSGGPYRILTWEWLCSRASIFQRGFPGYYLESWLSTSGYVDAGQNIIVDIPTDEELAEGKTASVSVRNISLMSHIQRWLDLATGGGTRYSDYNNAEFDTASVKNVTTPLFLGSDRQYLGSKVIYQTSGQTEQGGTNLGDFAGQASGGQQFRRRSFKFNENGFFMVMASLVPDVMYKYHKPYWHEQKNLADVYVPALDNIAMQPLFIRTLNPQIIEGEPGSNAYEKPINHINEELIGDKNYTFGWRRSLDDYQHGSLGYQPAWSELMHEVSKVHGRLATTMSYWSLLRNYGSRPDDTFLKRWGTMLEEVVSLSELDPDDLPGVPEGIYNPTSMLGKITPYDMETWAAIIDNMVVRQEYAPYVDPSAYNNVFSDTSRSAQNFVMTFSQTMIVNREKGKVNVPTIL